MSYCTTFPLSVFVIQLWLWFKLFFCNVSLLIIWKCLYLSANYTTYVNRIVLKYIHFSCFPLLYDEIYFFISREKSIPVKSCCEIFIFNGKFNYVINSMYSLEIQLDNRIETLLLDAYGFYMICQVVLIYRFLNLLEDYFRRDILWELFTTLCQLSIYVFTYFLIEKNGNDE
jgi:hypothetical protein